MAVGTLVGMTNVAAPQDQTVDIDGVAVHYVTWAGPEPADPQAPVFVLVHGLGGSWANWAEVAPSLAEHGPVFALDLGGHGSTSVAPAAARVPANLALLRRFIAAVSDRPVLVAGNSMGGLLAAQVAVAEPERVAGAVLIDPAIPLSPVSRPSPMVAVGFGIYATPLLGPWFMAKNAERFTLEQQVRATMRLVTADPSRVSPDLQQIHLEGARARRENIPDGDAQFLAAAKSVLWQLARRRRLAATMRAVTQPVLLLHGDRDQLINVRSARALAAANPTWTYVEGAGQGHTPMLDAPEWVATSILEWWQQLPS